MKLNMSRVLTGSTPCGKRKGYKVFGLIDYFTGHFFYQGQDGRLNSAAYITFLTRVLAQTTQPIILIQDRAKYHTSAETKAFFAQQTARLQIVQLPTYSPDYNPIEKLWKKIKQQDTHLHYFPTFEALTRKSSRPCSSLPMHRKKTSHSAACQSNWLRLLKYIYQTIFFLNAIALIIDRIRDIPTPSMHGLIKFLGTGAEIIGSARFPARAVQPVGREGRERPITPEFGVRRASAMVRPTPSSSAPD